MSRYSNWMGRRWTLTAVLGLVLLGCPATLQVLDYRTIQSDFEQAVTADNAAGLSALTGETRYEQVIKELTGEYIGKLDPELQANAWMLRAVSEWRAGKLGAARASAEKGLGVLEVLGNPSSLKRDQLILTMIPAQVVDSEAMAKWQAAGRKSSVVLSDELATSFDTALVKLGEAAGLLDEVSESAANYYHYQRWRMLRNWAQVITSIQVLKDDGTIDAGETQIAKRDALTRASGILDIDDRRPINKAAKAARDQITPGDPLLELIRRHEQ